MIAFSFGFAFLEPSVYQGTALFASLLVVFSILVYTLDVAWRKKKLRLLADMVDKIADQIPAVENETKTDSKIEIEDASVYGSENSRCSSNDKGVKN